jgi:S-layer homology domain
VYLNTMTQKKSQTNGQKTRFMGLLLGAALLSNSTAAMAQANRTVVKSNALDSVVANGVLNNLSAAGTAAPKADDKTAPEGDVKTPEVQPVAPTTEQQTAPKAEEKTPEVQPVAPTTEQQTAPKGQEKTPEQTPEVQPVAPTTEQQTEPKKDDKAPKGDLTAPDVKQQGGAVNLSDISGNWAEPFIRVLVEKGIIAGYPDGTFQPDRPVTRAEFAALVNKAFPDAPQVREAISFRDVPKRFWAAQAIAKASSTGFLAGYPNGTFGPSQNIKRIDSLVAFMSGTKLQADGTPANVDELFTDTNQVPGYGREGLVAATNRCVTVSVSYPEGRTFNPTGQATRADVAAFLHQVLVATGKLEKLAADSPAQKYIVNCAPAPDAPVAVKLTEQDVLGRTGVPAAPEVQQASAPAPINAPVGGVTTPNAFGANWGDFFVASGYQDKVPAIGRAGGNLDLIGLGAGFGIGNARDLVGLETSYSTSFSSNSRAFDTGNVNFKLHKLLGDNVSAAVGWENAISSGYTASNDPGSTVYGVVTGVLPVGDTSNFTASVGVGNGRFRSFDDIATDKKSTNVFGSLGFRASENFALAADYNGRNISLGLPISFKLGDNVGLQVTPSLLDIGGDSASSSRFGIGGGIGIRF